MSAPETRVEAVDIVRQLVERIELRPNEDGSLDAVLYGDLAAMVGQPEGSTIRRTANDPDCGGSGSLLSVVAGTRNQRCLQALRARLPTILPLTAATPVRIR